MLTKSEIDELLKKLIQQAEAEPGKRYLYDAWIIAMLLAKRALLDSSPGSEK